MFHQKYFNLSIVQEHSLDSFFALFEKAKMVYFDTETSGTSVRWTGKDYVVGYTFAFEDEVSKDVFYVPVRHDFEGLYKENNRFRLVPPKFFNPKYFPDFDKSKFEGEYYNVDAYNFAQRLRLIMENGGKTYIAHNIDFDLHAIANEDIDIVKVFNKNIIEDTMVMVHTIDETVEKNLEAVTKMIYGVEKSHYSDVIKTVTNDEKLSVGIKANANAAFMQVQIPIGGQYSAEDVWFMKQMFPQLIEGLKNEGMTDYYYKVRIPYLKVLWKMERKGFRIDTQLLEKMSKEAEVEIKNLEYKLYSLAGVEFNPSSSQNLYELLFGFKKKAVQLNESAQKAYNEVAKNLATKDKLSYKKQLMSERANVIFKESYNKDFVSRNFGFKVVEWTAGGQYAYEELKTPKVGKDELKKLKRQKVSKEAHKFIDCLTDYKKLVKLKSAFMDGLWDLIYEDDKVHCSFGLCGTDSFRLSCQQPNLQQLPHPLEEPKEGEDRTYFDFWDRFEIRKLFIADEGYSVVAADYHALEKFLTAHLSQDKMLIKMMVENLDPHGTVATLVFPELKDVNPNDVKKIAPEKRQIAKKIGFAVDYGGTSIAVSKNLEISKEEAQGYIDKYFEGFSGLHAYDKAAVKFARENGYVKTLGGHKRHLWDINSEDMKVRSYLERVAVNVLSQGSAADAVAFAQIDLDNDTVLNSIGAYQVSSVHDEVVMMCPTEFAHLCQDRMKYIMSHCMPRRGIHLTIPLEAETGEGKDYYTAK
jgi:DNA polymerase I-like protein with 3'-5' exonuclease and polymerase domains